MFSPELLTELRERAAALRATADGWAEQAADARKAAKDYEEQAMAARRREHELIALASYVEAHRVGDVLVAGVPQNPVKGPAPTTVFPVGEHPYSPQRAPFEAYRPATAEQGQEGS